jgi:hypothetical protein
VKKVYQQNRQAVADMQLFINSICQKTTTRTGGRFGRWSKDTNTADKDTDISSHKDANTPYNKDTNTGTSKDANTAVLPT